MDWIESYFSQTKKRESHEVAAFFTKMKSVVLTGERDVDRNFIKKLIVRLSLPKCCSLLV
jgi:hypothetical protein